MIDVSEVVANFNILATNIPIPANYTQYKVIIENDEITGYELI